MDDERRAGTFAPLRRASLRPMAIACLRLVTFRPELLSSVLFFRRRIVDSTFFEAPLLYFAITTSVRVPLAETQALLTPTWLLVHDML